MPTIFLLIVGVGIVFFVISNLPSYSVSSSGVKKLTAAPKRASQILISVVSKVWVGKKSSKWLLYVGGAIALVLLLFFPNKLVWLYQEYSLAKTTLGQDYLVPRFGARFTYLLPLFVFLLGLVLFLAKKLGLGKVWDLFVFIVMLITALLTYLVAATLWDDISSGAIERDENQAAMKARQEAVQQPQVTITRTPQVAGVKLELLPVANICYKVPVVRNVETTINVPLPDDRHRVLVTGAETDTRKKVGDTKYVEITARSTFFYKMTANAHAKACEQPSPGP